MDLQEIKRKYFRVRISDTDDISLKVNNVEYQIVDVGDHGLGIRLTPEDIFITVEEKLPIELKIKGVVHNLEGKVVHISPAGPEEFLCGIDLLNLDRQAKEKLMGYLKSSKEKLFGEV